MKSRRKMMSKIYEATFWPGLRKEDCHKPKWVNVGRGRVWLCGWQDFYEKERKFAKRELDIFFGLSSGWEDEVGRGKSENKYVKKFLSMMGVTPWDGLLVWEIKDGGVDEEFGGYVTEVFKKGWKIGWGCLGGHGRTGWLLGWLMREVEGLEGDELITKVRRRWCGEAIESKKQVESLGGKWKVEEKKEEKKWSSEEKKELESWYERYKRGEVGIADL